MGSLTTIGIAVVFGALCYYLLQRKRRAKAPPGPWGLPIVGNLFSLDSQLFPTFEKWGKQYGPVVSVKLGSVEAVILDDVQVIREALNNSAVAGRADSKLFNHYAGGKHGMVNSEGQEWVEQRRFALRALREFGFGTKSMESLIMDEVNEIMDWISKTEGTPVSLNRKFSLAVVNALMTVLSGKRYQHDDPVLKNILDTASAGFNEASESGVLWFFPQLAALLPMFFSFEKMIKAGEPFRQFFKDIANEHLKHEGDSSNVPDFCYAYLKEIRNTTDPESSFYKERGENCLPIILFDLYGAGSGTTTAALAWVFLYLLTHPKAQAKLQKELDEVTGGNRALCLADRPNTPYAEAVINETLRFSSITPWGVFHSTLEEVEIGGYRIPKDTVIIPNLHSVHYNADIWGDPENFRPERFLSEDGKTVKRNEAMLAFSTGKRICVGEALARDEIYLFLTNILSKYQIIPDPADPKPSLVPNGAFALEAKPYTAIFKERSI